MPTKLTQLLAAICGIILLSNCDPTTYITEKHYFNKEYQLEAINAPDYPFKGPKEQQTISIDFPKQGEFRLYFGNSQCEGKYDANIEGSFSIKQSNCSSHCCESSWELYVLTLIRKATRYEGGENNPLVLLINDNNYLVLETHKKAYQPD